MTKADRVGETLTVCALLIFFTSHCCSPVKVSREMAPSELPQARIRPKSYGPQHTEFTVHTHTHTLNYLIVTTKKQLLRNTARQSVKQ